MRTLTLNEFYSRDTIFFGHHMSSYFVHHRGNCQDHHFLSYGTDFFLGELGIIEVYRKTFISCH